MSKSRTVLMASMMKHAVASGVDPFAANYTNANTEPVAPPAGSIEAKRQEEAGAGTAQAEADMAKAQEETKIQENQVKAVQKANQGMIADLGKANKETSVLQAKVDAYEARDAAKAPGLSPSFNAGQTRMLDSIKKLRGSMGKGAAEKKYDAAVYARDVTHLMAKAAWWTHYDKLSKPEQLLALTKRATMIATDPTTTKPAGGNSVQTQSVGNSVPDNTPDLGTGAPAPKPATPAASPAPKTDASGRPSAARREAALARHTKMFGAPKAMGEAAPGVTESDSQKFLRSHGGTKDMSDAQRMQYKSMLGGEAAVSQAQADADTSWGGLGKAFGTAEGRAGMGGEISRMADDPSKYIEESGSKTSLRDAAFRAAGGDTNAHAWSAGNILPSIAKGVGTAGDWIKNPFISAGSNLISGGKKIGQGTADVASSVPTMASGAMDAAGNWKNQQLARVGSNLANKDQSVFDAFKGVDANPLDNMAAGTQAGRDQANRGWDRLGTGATNLGKGALTVGALALPAMRLGGKALAPGGGSALRQLPGRLKNMTSASGGRAATSVAGWNAADPVLSAGINKIPGFADAPAQGATPAPTQVAQTGPPPATQGAAPQAPPQGSSGPLWQGKMPTARQSPAWGNPFYGGGAQVAQSGPAQQALATANAFQAPVIKDAAVQDPGVGNRTNTRPVQDPGVGNRRNDAPGLDPGATSRGPATWTAPPKPAYQPKTFGQGPAGDTSRMLQAGAKNSPNFVQVMNDYSMGANPDFFPQTANNQLPGNGTLLGSVFNQLQGTIGGIDPRTFYGGPGGATSFRNQQSPAMPTGMGGAMTGAMNAFGRLTPTRYQTNTQPRGASGVPITNYG